MWKLWTLTLLTRPKCVANWMKLHSSFLRRCKTCTCKVVPITYTALVSEIFSTTAHGGPSGETLRKNWATECNLKRTQLTLFTRHFGLTFYTEGLKGSKGCPWAQLLSPKFAVFLRGRTALSRHSTNESWSLTKSSLKWLLVMKN